MNGLITSWIRTAVPVAVGAVLTWLASVTGVVLSAESSVAVTATAMTLIVAVYYALVRLFELRWPRVGILLGADRQPSYGAAAKHRRPLDHRPPGSNPGDAGQGWAKMYGSAGSGP